MKSQYVIFPAVCRPPLRRYQWEQTVEFSAVTQAAGRNIALQSVWSVVTAFMRLRRVSSHALHSWPN